MSGYPGYPSAPPSEGGGSYQPYPGTNDAPPPYPGVGGSPYPPAAPAPYPPAAGGAPYPGAPGGAPYPGAPAPGGAFYGAGSPYPPTAYPQQHQPPPQSQQGKTPFTWSSTDKHQYLDVVNNGQDLRYNSQHHRHVEDENLFPTARASGPVKTGSNFFFEILIVDSGRNHEIGVGVTGTYCNLEKGVGWEQCSLGYHGDEGGIYFESDDPMEEEKRTKNHKYKTGDVIGVSFDAQMSALCFYKNKEVVRNIQLKPHHLSQPLYASVSMSSPGAVVRALHMSPPVYAPPPAYSPNPPGHSSYPASAPGSSPYPGGGPSPYPSAPTGGGAPYPGAGGAPPYAAPPTGGAPAYGAPMGGAPQYPGAPTGTAYPPYPGGPQASAPYAPQPSAPYPPQAPYPSGSEGQDKGLGGMMSGLLGKGGGKGMLGKMNQALSEASKMKIPGGGKIPGSVGQMMSGFGGGSSSYAPPPTSQPGKTPFTWSQGDKQQFLEVIGNGQDVSYSGRYHEQVEDDNLGPSVRASGPLNTGANFFFEIKIMNEGQNKEIAVGVSGRSCDLAKMVGWDSYSVGYHGDDGSIYFEGDDPVEETGKSMKTGDVVGVVFDAQQSSLSFYKNSKLIKSLRMRSHMLGQPLFATLSISSPGAVVRALHMDPPMAPGPAHYSPPQGHYGGQEQQYGGGASGMVGSSDGVLSNCRGNKKALLIGINYFGQSGELRGCINDVQNIKRLIQSRGFTDSYSTMRILTDDNRDPSAQPTRQNIIEGFHWLLSGAQPNDSLFLHYSGHGGQSSDQDGDEVDGCDETICPVDYQRSGQIVDDEMNALLVQRLPPGVRLTAIFDSCHSATALDLPYIYDCDGNIKKQKASRKKAAMSALEAAMDLRSGNVLGLLSSGKDAINALTAISNEDEANAMTQQTRRARGDVVMFAGCKDSQTSADTSIAGQATGACSYAFIDAVNRTGGNVTFIDLLSIMRDTLRRDYSQVVQMSTGFETDMQKPFIF